MRRSYLQWLFSATLVRLNIPVQYKQVSGSILKLLQQTTDNNKEQRTTTKNSNKKQQQERTTTQTQTTTRGHGLEQQENNR